MVAGEHPFERDKAEDSSEGRVTMDGPGQAQSQARASRPRCPLVHALRIVLCVNLASDEAGQFVGAFHRNEMRA